MSRTSHSTASAPNAQDKLTLPKALAIVVALDEITSKYVVDPDRLSNGLKLMRDGKAYYSEPVGGWICHSQSGSNCYAVDLENALCTCPDAENRGTICKHFIACWLTNRVNHILDAARELVKQGAVIASAKAARGL